MDSNGSGSELQEELQVLDEFERRLAFAGSAVGSIQEMLRAMDLKAQFLIAASGLIVGLILPVFSFPNLLQKLMQGPAYGVLIGCVVVILSTVTVTMIACIAVIYPRSGTRESPDELPGLSYPLIILARHESLDAYVRALHGHSATDLLRDYAHQVVECSHIFRIKQWLLRIGVVALGFAIGAWFVLIGASLLALLH